MNKKILRITIILLGLAVAVFVFPRPLPDGLAEYGKAMQQKIDKAVHNAVMKQCSGHTGEFGAEGHVILSTEEKESKLTVYALATYVTYEFQNEAFVLSGGSFVIPSAIVFSVGTDGKLSLLDYTEFEGEDLLKEVFPESLWYLASYQSRNAAEPKLNEQITAQAKAYLESIGREDVPIYYNVDKEYIEAGTLGSFGVGERKPELEDYPDWLGTREQLENGTRYIYESAKTKQGDSDIYTFSKKKEDGTVVEQYKYKVTGNKVVELTD